MFTYQHIREDIKKMFNKNPVSCMLPCTVDWMIHEIKKLPENATVVEFGTFLGGTIAKLAQANPTVKIHSIDLNNFESWRDDDHMVESIRSFHKLPELKMSDLSEIQKIQTEDYPNIRLYTGDSTDLDINNIAMALIDARHYEEDVLKELNYIWPRMLEGGCIFGDDANDPGVANAFLKFAKTKDIEVSFYSKCAKIVKQSPISDTIRSDHVDTLLFTEHIHC
jgi:predicted O-methyltransferase YrrM